MNYIMPGIGWAQEDDDGDEPGEGDAKVKGNSAKSEQKKPKGKKPKKAKQNKKGPAKGAAKQSESLYRPGEYKDAWKAFVADLKENGRSHKEAQAEWNNSVERAELLAGLSHSELKRRRFIYYACSAAVRIRMDVFTRFCKSLQLNPWDLGKALHAF
eukprot:s279_g3.t2